MRQARVLKRIAAAAAVALASFALCGCDIPSFIDNSEMSPNLKGRALQKPILTSLSMLASYSKDYGDLASIDDPEQTFLNSTEIKPDLDNKVIAQDYRLGVGDSVVISVNDLVGLGVETTKQTRVSESGNISMPLIGQIKAVGLTEDDLQKAVADEYRKQQIITNAQVSCTVVEARNRTFSALGAVNAPGQYAIPQADFRLLDALVMIRDIPVTIDDVYIIRQLSEEPGAAGTTPAKPVTPSTPSTPGTPTTPAPTGDPLAPKPSVIGGPVGQAAPVAGQPVLAQSNDPLAKPTGSTPFQFAAPSGTPETRTIHISLPPLRTGDLKYNIVIRPKDLIVVPTPPNGNYYLGGHIARAGVYSLPGRGITLKQAIISAGMLDGEAIPERTELIRRVGTNREVFVSINLAAIYGGQQPDLYLKPEDIVHVGTNIIAPFVAAIRGGFRFTYGFGFLYDRNFYTGGTGF